MKRRTGKPKRPAAAERGEYRVVYVAFADDPDVHALTPIAFKLLIMLKLSLPVTGIGVIYPSKLCDQVGCERAQLEASLAELEQPKPGRELGWIVRDRNVVWLVNALACEPSLTAANVQSHVPFVRKLVAGLDQRLEVVAKFHAHYHQWFQRVPTPTENPTSTVPDRVHERVRDPITSTTATATASTTALQSNGNGAVNGAAPFSESAAVEQQPPELPASALDFLRWSCDYRGATDARRDDVRRQLLDLLTPAGAKLDRDTRVRTTVDRLSEKCLEVMREGVRERSKAIVVLLLKLNNTAEVTEAAAATASAELQHEERATAAAIERAIAWVADHADVAAAIEGQLDQAGFGPDDLGQFTRNIARRSAIVTAWRDAGSPEPVHA